MLDERIASQLASLALAHVMREYPNKLDHVILDRSDVRTPSELHPVFFGSFDWHSCVHGYWLLATLWRLFPSIPMAAEIEELFTLQLTHDKIAAEAEYAAHASRGGFERPYGWAWLLMLAAELKRHTDGPGRNWCDVLEPLSQCFVQRFREFLPKATYPVRVGTHFNTAFALRLALEYTEVVATAQSLDLRNELCVSAKRWYLHDVDCQAWEPGGDDFLSSALMEAECMRCVLTQGEFAEWFGSFLPRLDSRLPVSLFTPAVVSDRTDGKIAHLDGLNLSRAWCWRSLASSLSTSDPRRSLALEAAEQHLAASLPWVSGDYMGEHWLATFALLALYTDRV